MLPAQEVPLEFCNSCGGQKTEWCPYQNVKKVWWHVHSFRHSIGIGQTDRIGKTISCSACWRVIKTERVHRQNSGMKAHTCRGKWLLDGVNADNSDTVARDNPITEIAITVELHVARQFSVRHHFRCLLQLQQLIVYASTFLRHNKERIHRALRTSSLITITSHTVSISNQLKLTTSTILYITIYTAQNHQKLVHSTNS